MSAKPPLRPLRFEACEQRISLTSSVPAANLASFEAVEVAKANLGESDYQQAAGQITNKQLLRHVSTLSPVDVERDLPSDCQAAACDDWLATHLPCYDTDITGDGE